MTTNGGRAVRDVSTFEDFVATPAGRALRRHVNSLAGRHGLADDVWQEVSTYAWLNWATFHDQDHVIASCVRKARNHLTDLLRAFGPERIELCDALPDDALGEAPDPHDLFVGYESRRARWRAFGRLPAHTQALLLHHAQTGERYDVLAAERGTTVGALRVQIHRARRELRDVLAHGPARILTPLVPITAALGKGARAVRRGIANLARPSTTAGRVVVGVTVVTTAFAPMPVRLPMVFPAFAEPIAANERHHATGQPERPGVERGVTAALVAPASVPYVRGNGAQAPASPRPSPTCLAELVCLRPDDGSSPDPNEAVGEEVCAKAVSRCVSQQEVGGMCPYMVAVPEDVATCDHYSDTHNTLPAPPGQTPTPSPASAPGGFP